MKQPRRKLLRLTHYDYSKPGAYFITLVTQNRLPMFGHIHDGIMLLSVAGRAVQSVWENLKEHYHHMEPDAFVIMPNHFHAIIRISDRGGCIPITDSNAPRGAPGICSARKPRHGLSEIVRALKTFSAKKINELLGTPGEKVWQRGFHDHIIRDENALDSIREYIVNNPLKWELDRENPNARPPSEIRGS